MRDALLWTIICLLILMAFLLAPDHLVVPAQGLELTRVPAMASTSLVAISPAPTIEAGDPVVLLRNPGVALK